MATLFETNVSLFATCVSSGLLSFRLNIPKTILWLERCHQHIIPKRQFHSIGILVYAIINQNFLKAIRGNNLMKFAISLTGNLFQVIDGFFLVFTP